MPRRLPVPCSQPGCPALVRSGRCPAHSVKRAASEKDYDARRGSTRGRGYDAAWERLRALKLSRDPLCEVCESLGDTTPADTVDHVVELRDGGERLSEDNLQSLCRGCHAAKTAHEKERRGLLVRRSGG